MRKFLSSYSVELKIFPVFIVLFLFTRLYRIMSLPLFTDEAIYTRWSQIALQDAQWRFISLTDGKQPSFIWLDMIMMKFVSDPLLAGRLVSVIAGFFVAIGLYLLGREMFQKRIVGIIAAFLYILFPMGLVYDRMALYDSLVALFGVWTLYFHIILFRHPRLDLAFVQGLVLGGGVLTKTSGFLFIYMTPLLLLITKFKKKEWKNDVKKWALLVLVSIFFAYFYYSTLRLSPFFHIISAKNSTFVYPFGEWIQHPLRFVMGNLSGLFDWAFGYLTIPIVGFAILPFIYKCRDKIGEKLLLLVWFAFPFVGLATFGKVLYPRFIFFMLLPILLLAAYGLYVLLTRFEKLWIRILIVLIAIVGLIRSDIYILTNFAYAPIPKSDLEQYVNGWPAGGGTNEVIEILSKEAEKGDIFVGSEGTFGSLPTYAVEIYLGENKKVHKQGYYPLPAEIPLELIEQSKIMPTFFILNESEEPPAWPMEEIGVFQKGKGDSFMRLYKVIPQS